MNRAGYSIRALVLHKLTKLLLERYSVRVLLNSQDKLRITSSSVLMYFRLVWNLQVFNSETHVEYGRKLW